MADTTFICGADFNYYPLLREWLQSVRRFPQSAGIDVCIMDVGLTPDQVRELTPLVTRIVKPDWPAPVPARKVANKEYLKACVCRPFIPDIFPGYKAYLWMDADTWVQDWDVFSLFLRAVKEKPDRMVLTGLDRAYARAVLRVYWMWRWPTSIRCFYLNNAQKSFGFDVAKKLMPMPTLAAGCFALAVDAPHWKRWQELTLHAMKRDKIFTAEQTALGVLIYIEKFKAEILPSYAYWQSINKPLWDEERQLFVEPFMPHTPLGAMNLTGAMRAGRHVTAPYETLRGTVVQRNVRNPHFDGGQVMAGTPKRA